MTPNAPLRDWSAAYLLDSAPEVMDYVMRGRRFARLSLASLRGEYAFGLLRDAVQSATEDEAKERADLNAEFALRDEDRRDAAFPSLRWMAAHRPKAGRAASGAAPAGEF